MALSSVGVKKVEFAANAGALEPSFSKVSGDIVPRWVAGGVEQVTNTPSFNLAANDSNCFYEVAAWESASLDTQEMIIDVATLEGVTELHARALAYGSITGLPLTYLRLIQNANLTGSINGMALTYLSMTENANLSGSINGMPLTHLNVSNNDNIIGSIDGMALTYLSLSGNNIVTGSITGMALTYLRILSNDKVTGSVDGMPLTYLNVGNNDNLTGSISGMPLELLSVSGNSNLSGSINGMPLTYLRILNNNNITGSIDGMGLFYFFLNEGANITWSSVPTFASSSRFVRYTSSNATEAMIDLLLEGAANVTTWTNEKTVTLTGNAVPPSAAGLAFIPTIQAAGATVATN